MSWIEPTGFSLGEESPAPLPAPQRERKPFQGKEAFVFPGPEDARGGRRIRACSRTSWIIRTNQGLVVPFE